ncbi:enoyl CoA hydratase domain-containing protein 1 [Nowakowskiella sp. JEL0407]|nr:enoyl CoA hydratase domain-containing protein 1 [Nowakowskiella sp. JEL0407]
MSVSLSQISLRISKITIDNPQKKNAISLKMMQDFSNCVDTLSKDEQVCAVIVTGGDNSSFCSGFDLGETNSSIAPQEFADNMSKQMQTILLKLSTLPIISVAAVNGYALGGGAELTTSCDFIVTDRSAKIRFVQIRMGVVPAWGGGMRLLEKIGAKEALKLLGTAKLITPETGLSLGLVDAVVDEAVQGAIEYLDQFLYETGKDGERIEYGTEVIRGMKKVINNAKYHGINYEVVEEILKVEREVFSGLWGEMVHFQLIILL